MSAPATPERRPALGLCVAAWCVPGLGHALIGKPGKGIVLLVVLTALCVTGLAFGGRVFPLAGAEPLVWLAAAAEWGLGVPRLIVAIGGWGEGTVVAATYEFGNTFLISAGLLNVLAVLDVYDIAVGRKS